ncbi:MAG: methyltransferase domain-containing protein [Halorhodospira halophila]|uniref:sarcosine/dimethylglycine N-methyltransferase n=1 Tax=Halorhodospira TaxID=85108 RepID=UPI001914179F|nr:MULTISPECIES: sarcosine/dimethylglycine N-methyltransferase [Halorhodospira]MBK5936404.1 SAM-dependent methyltransferase [Halorhodospira halophila]MBK5943992.1 SAM-dependent methyltransferase [Halorhodospira halophila]MCC3750421.1 methyltransferase domain-containing protein [Halorhodospira halophila]MCG5527893.1 methyltransferase domain-containing protein [Halorhodospira halophila]MCG5533221.1 methyltransferase domain-containing protein [Halorhodospira sp. 9621]
MSQYDDEAIEVARQYYNSRDADNFYFHIWGGEDLHVGIYHDEDEPIFDASRRTVERMASKLSNLSADSYVLDVGAGYGGVARYLAHTYGCRVVALNLSERENERDRQMNKEQGVDHLIEVVDGAFEDIPFDAETFDIVWCQDSFLHSGDRPRVMSEVTRVLKKGGEFIFTDPMQADDCPEGVIQPILDRIHLSTMGTPSFYRDELKKNGMTELEFEDNTPQLPRHYGRVHKELERRGHELDGIVSDDYVARMKKGLQHWVEGGNNGYLTWGIFHFRKD